MEVTLFDQDTGISNYHAVTGSTVGPLLAELEKFDVVTLLEPGMTAVLTMNCDGDIVTASTKRAATVRAEPRTACEGVVLGSLVRFSRLQEC